MTLTKMYVAKLSNNKYVVVKQFLWMKEYLRVRTGMDNDIFVPLLTEASQYLTLDGANSALSSLAPLPKLKIVEVMKCGF